MAVSKAAALLATICLAACSPPPPVAAPSIVAPLPVEYSCAQLARAAAEFDKIEPGSMIDTMMDDYRVERKALRGIHKLPEQRCPRSS